MSNLLPLSIDGTGVYVPERVVTNQHFVDYLDTNEEWIVTRTGIKERRWAAPDETTATMAAKAAEAALADASITANDLDMIVCATSTADYQFPAAACVVQDLIGAKDVPAFDVCAACAGFLYATEVAAGLLSGGHFNRVLVIGAETLSRFLDSQDRATVLLLGDAAGACVMTRPTDSKRGILWSEFGGDGSRAKHIWVPAGGSALPASETTSAERLHFMRMKGREVYKFAVLKMMDLIDRGLEATGISPDELKMVIPHQSNLRIIESVRKKMNLSKNKVAINIDRFGNTSAASIIMSLHEARRDGAIEQGDLVLFIALGAGLTWGAMIVRM